MGEGSASAYGSYTVTDALDISLPGTEIRVARAGGSAFSYSRRDAGGTIEKMIPSESGQVSIEVAPIRPLNYPARRTSHMYLELDREIYLGGGAAASVYVRCPIEIGVFLAGQGRDSLDWIACNKAGSRFGLYGPPDTGLLCKHARAQLASGYADSEPYSDGVMRIVIENTLKSGQAVSKVVFPITDNSVYYDGDRAAFDGIHVTLKKRGSVGVADITVEPAEAGWQKSPTWEETTVGTAMEMGLE